MDNFFGGKDPFDHPFFTQPFGGLLRDKSPFYGFNGPFDNPFFNGAFGDPSGARKQITIEELDSKNAPSKEVFADNSNDYPTGIQSFSFQRTAYGGPDGVYYTSSVGRRSGGDGLFLIEMKEEDRMVGESLHTISKGIHDKGHSVTTNQFSDGKVNSMQTLHNLHEDELTSFQEQWKMNAEKVFPGWNNGFSLLANTGVNNNAWDDLFGWGGWPQLQLESSGAQSDGEAQQGPSSRGPSRKIVPVE